MSIMIRQIYSRKFKIYKKTPEKSGVYALMDEGVKYAALFWHRQNSQNKTATEGGFVT